MLTYFKVILFLHLRVASGIIRVVWGDWLLELIFDILVVAQEAASFSTGKTGARMCKVHNLTYASIFHCYSACGIVVDKDK